MNQKTLSAVSLALFLNLSLAQANNLSHPSQSTFKKTQQMQTQNKNNEIIAFLITIDKSEISAAKVAKSKHLNPKVEAFADLMIKDHSANLRAAKNLGIVPVETAKIVKLKQEGNKGLKTLESINGKAFESTYVEMMVKGHKKALSKINKYLHETTNSKIITLLKATRVSVEQHLKKAEKLKSI